ncbi:type III-A CRISPR-associated protein Csm2 [candidate division KSB1 bacterium]|nr:type III-A CRISPR-associated protein Csm2 [candidate division KSB1 bacterium]
MGFEEKLIQEGKIVKEETRKILTEVKSLSEFGGEALVNTANSLGKYLYDIRMNTTQIRKFLDAAEKIKTSSIANENLNVRSEAMMIKPKLAYAVGRNDDKMRKKLMPLMEILNICIDKINNRADFEQFSKFLQAIVAYHKYYGGKS